jgi:hypothetical protein
MFSEFTEQYGDAVAKGQQVVLEATEAWADLVRHSLKVPSLSEVPDAAEAINQAFDLARRALEVQHAALKGVAEAWQPVVDKASAEFSAWNERLVGAES